MRKFTKMMFTLALLFGAVGGVSSRTNVDFGENPTVANATWNQGTNTFAWTAENAYIVIPGLSGDLTGCYLDFTIGAACHIDIVYTDDTKTEGGWNGYGRFGNAGSKTQDLGFMAGAKINSVKEVRICSQSASGSMTITGVSYYYPLRLEFDACGIATVPFYSIITSGGVTFDKATGTVTNTNGNGYLAIELPTSGMDLSNIKKIKVNYTGSDDLWGSDDNRILKNLEIPGVNTWSGSRYDCDYTDWAAKSSNVTAIRWNAGGKTGGSLTISSIKFTSEFTSCAKAGETILKSLDWNKMDGTGKETPAWNMDGSSDTYFGNLSGDATHYTDLTAYSELRVYCKSSSDGFRAFFIKAGVVYDAGNKSSYEKQTNTYATSAATWHETEKYYSLDLSKVEKWNDKVALKSIKSDPWSATNGQNVTNIVAYKTPAAGSAEYLITGKGLLDDATTTLLANANVTSIDATGMTNVTKTTLTSANPNCLFIDNANKLNNTKNVIVDGVCNNLELKDGEPFKAPSAFTATNAKFTRKFSSADYATMVVPFDVATLPTQPATVKAYKLKGVNGEAITTDVLTSLTANEPVMVKVTADDVNSYEFTASGVSVAATSGDLVENGLLKATYATTTAAADANNYVLQKNGDDVNDVNFYLVTGTSATVKPFRAYLHYEYPGAAHILSILFDDATGIEKVEKDASVKENGEFFNLAGQRVAQPTKGLYIVNGKKVVVK